MKNKKIAILTERMKQGFGVDLVVHEQASRLVKKHVVCVFAIEVDPKMAKAASYNMYNLSIPLAFNPIKQDYFSTQKFHSYSHLLRSFDTFIIQTPTFNTWIPRLRRYGQVIVYYHGNSPSDSYVGLKRFRKPIFEFMENNLYFHFAHRIVTISNFLKRQLSTTHHTKTEIIPHGTEHVTNIWQRLSNQEKSKIKSKYFISDKEKLITYIGRLDFRNNPYKQTDHLILLKDRLKDLRKRKVSLIAIGYPENGIEEVLYQAGIRVMPNVSSQELVVILGSSWVYFSPSSWEGFNLPFIEAQALGVPVVGYKCGAHHEVVNSSKSGFLADNLDEATDKINVLITQPNLRNQMSKAALNHAANFTWSKNVKQLEQLL